MSIIEMKGDIKRLQDTVYQVLIRTFDQETESEYICQNYNWMIFGKIENQCLMEPDQETNIASSSEDEEITCMKDDIKRLQDTIYHVLASVFRETESKHFYSNYNWMIFGKIENQYMLDLAEETIISSDSSESDEIVCMKDDINRLQDTVYQLLGVIFQGSDSDYIFENYNWMKCGKRYNKGWLKDNGEPMNYDSDDDEYEEAHYFEYKYLKHNLPERKI